MKNEARINFLKWELNNTVFTPEELDEKITELNILEAMK